MRQRDYERWSRALQRTPRRLRRIGFAIVALFALTASHCSSDDDDRVAQAPPPGGSPSGPPQTPPATTCWDASLDIDPGVGCHRVSFDVAAGDAQIYSATLIYPDVFEFNGFDLVGPFGTVIGTLGQDFTFDDVADTTLVLLSLDRGTAYADLTADGRFNPTFEPVLTSAGRNAFHLLVPFGGDLNDSMLTTPFDARVTLRVREELMTASMGVGSSFTVSGELTSVDPDTGNHDDRLGAAPTVTPFTSQVTIDEGISP